MEEFAVIIEKCVFNSPDYKVYGAIPVEDKNNFFGSSKYKYNMYGNISLVGNFHELEIGLEYIVNAELENGKRGWAYKVKKIRQEKPNSVQDIQNFLEAIITEREATILLNAYPNIINMIINNEPVDLSKTVGIKDFTFNKIKNKVIENFALAELIDEFKDYDISYKQLRKLYETYASVEHIREKMNEDPYNCLCTINGIGFKTADKLILKIRPELKNSKQRLESCIDYILEENENNGHTKIKKSKLRSEVEDTVLDTIQYFDEITTNDKKYVLIEEWIAKRYTYETECYISNKLKELNYKNPLAVDYTSYQDLGDFKLTVEQMQGIKNFCEWQVSFLEGNAGSGKSASTKAIVQLCKDNNLSFALAAPTGKASKVLGDFTGEDAKTIHRLLGYTPEGFMYNEEYQLPYDALIIDECSMLDIFLAKHLFLAIDPEKTRILFVQDPAQISSVSAGCFSRDCIDSKMFPVTTLTKIFRYNDDGLIKVATDSREGKSFLKGTGIETFGDDKNYVFIETAKERTLEVIKKVYKKFIEAGIDPIDIAVLTPTNKHELGTKNINKEIQEIVNPESNSKPEVAYGENVYRLNDIVMQIVNNYRATNDQGQECHVYNGFTGKIIKINKRDVYIDFGDNVVVYDKTELDNIQKAYSYTVHKSQGSSIKYVILITSSSHTWQWDRGLLYVGITRTKAKCYHIGEKKTVDYALWKCENKERRTFLKDLLKN